MKNKTILFSTILFSLLFSACSNTEKDYDASGSFEAIERLISAEASGKIMELQIEEGQKLTAGDTIGYIDSTQLHLKKLQIEAQIAALLSKKPNVALQLAALKEQLNTAEIEKNRILALVKGNAVPTKQLDDVNASIAVIKKQIAAQNSALNISKDGINNDAKSIITQLDQVEDQLKKSIIINPINGTVTTKLAYNEEFTATGKPLYKIADLDNITLRVYITGKQLPQIKLKQEVRVKTDDGNGGFKDTTGTITWISDKAEFTPKTIQTKDERANLVYAIKVSVKNDGSYKMGMYGEIKF